MPFGVDPDTAQQQTVIGTSQKFAAAMDPGLQYFLHSTVDCWVAIGATGGAAVADAAGNAFLKAGVYMALRNTESSGKVNSFVHLIREGSTSGKATLVRVGP